MHARPYVFFCDARPYMFLSLLEWHDATIHWSLISKYHQTYLCLQICDLSEVVASSPRGNLVGDSQRYTSSPVQPLTFHSHKFKYTIWFTFELPRTKHTLSLCTQTSWLSLFCPFISALSLSHCMPLWAGIPEPWVRWHHMLWMNPAYSPETRELSYCMRKNTVKKKENSSHIGKVCSACWGLIKERAHKKSLSWQAPVCSRKNTHWL